MMDLYKSNSTAESLFKSAVLNNQLEWTWKEAFVAILAVYIAICSMLRFRREKYLRRKLSYPDRASLGRMTNEDAQQILQFLITSEFPYMYKTSLQFALLKV